MSGAPQILATVTDDQTAPGPTRVYNHRPASVRGKTSLVSADNFEQMVRGRHTCN
jgi:hypothetical protein